MAFTEFRVSQESGADTVNAGYCGSDGTRCGANESALYTTTGAVCDIDNAGGAALLQLTDTVGVDGSYWIGCEVGDWLIFDTAGEKVFRRITDITGAVATVDRACTYTGLGKECRVNGAWNNLTTAGTFLTSIAAATWPSGVASPRVNVKYYAAAYDNTAADANFTSTWNSEVPFAIMGFTTTYGDLSWATVTEDQLPIINLGTRRLKSTSAASGAYCLKLTCTGDIGMDWQVEGNTASGIFLTMSATGPGVRGIYSLGQFQMFQRCLVRMTGLNHAGRAIYSGGSGSKFVGCVAEGSYSGYGHGFYLADAGVMMNCVSYQFANGITGSYLNYFIGYCSINNCTTGLNISATRGVTSSLIVNNKIGYCTTGISSAAGAVWHPSFSSNEFEGCTNNITSVTTDPSTVAGDQISDADEMYVDHTTNDLRTTFASHGTNNAMPKTFLNGLAAGADFGAIQAVVTIPAIDKVSTTAPLYGYYASLSGTLSGGICDYPSADDVRFGVEFDIYTGSIVLPSAENVEEGILYGASGVELSGTLAAGEATQAFHVMIG